MIHSLFRYICNRESRKEGKRINGKIITGTKATIFCSHGRRQRVAGRGRAPPPGFSYM